MGITNQTKAIILSQYLGQETNMTFTPLISYAGYAHVLNAVPCFVHPNGNLYGVAIEKQAGLRQNLSVYRVRPGSDVRELVHRYVGGIDSQAQIAAGGCVILQDGSLQVWASAVPVGIPPITQTGFVGGFWEPIPGTDEPWSSGGAQGPPGPQGAAGPPGSGGMVLLPAPRTSPAWEGRTLTGGVEVDVPLTFGVPSASAYRIRFVALAAAANIRIRAGTRAAPFFVTVNTQVPNNQIHTTGYTPGPLVYVSVVDGNGVAATARVFFQIVGHS